MNGKQIFADLKKGFKPNRNGFDLEAREIFTLKVGQKIPVFNQACLPGGSYKINPISIIETLNPFQTKAYIRLRTTLDFYFFPYAYSNTLFNQFIAGRKDNTLRTQIGKDLTVTKFNLFKFVQYVLGLYGFAYYFSTDGLAKSASVTDMKMADFCHLQISPDSFVPADVIRNLDMMGYGNYLPLCKIIEKYVSTLSDDLTYIQAWEKLMVDNYVDSNTSFIEFLLMTSTNLATFTESVPVGTAPTYDDKSLWIYKMYNLHVPAAYNRVYDAFVRNSYYTESLVNYIMDPQSGDIFRQEFDFAELFNFDQVTEFDVSTLVPTEHGGVYGHAADINTLLMIFAIKPSSHFKDMFTGILPDSQFGDISVMLDNRAWLGLQVKTGYEFFAGDSPALEAKSLVDGDNHPAGTIAPIHITDGDKYRFDPALAISVLEQRKANALQRFRERQMRAGNRTSDNFEVHYGVKPYSNTDMLPTYLGSFEGSLTPNPVVATAEAGDYSVGSRAAYGTGTIDGKEINFDSKDFGCVIGIMSVVPYDDYNSFMINKEHSKVEQFDYMFPEFDDLGLQAASLDDFSIYGFMSQAWKQDVIRGYLMRYYEHKMACDKVHGELYHGFLPRVDDYTIQSFDMESAIKSIYMGAFSHYVAARPTLDPTAESFLYVQPNELDSVFGYAANQHQVTDQFICNINFNSSAIQPLSVLGLPY